MKTTKYLLLSFIALSTGHADLIEVAETPASQRAAANIVQLAPAIQRALEKWAASHEAERDAAKDALAAKTQRIQDVLKSRLEAERKQNAALNLSDGPRSKLLRDLIAEAAAPEKLLKRQALEAEIAAKKKELDAMK
jgi:crotonobetainyl-CoA:carnitine CoA-transferase CaiB-like acyl-CoA transferase